MKLNEMRKEASGCLEDYRRGDFSSPYEIFLFLIKEREEKLKNARREEIKKCISDFEKADIQGFSRCGSAGASMLFNNAMEYFNERLKELSRKSGGRSRSNITGNTSDGELHRASGEPAPNKRRRKG